MDPRDNQSAVRDGSFGVPVQPQNSLSIDITDLREFDSDVSEYLRRLETDQSIVTELRAVRFEGTHYDYFATELAKYGFAVIRSWVTSGKIFGMLASRGLGQKAAPSELLLQDEHAEEIAGETVAEALKNFRNYVLIPGRWDPKKKASIRTYFIGQCLLRFGNVYRRWYAETVNPPAAVELHEEMEKIENITAQVELKLEVEQALARVKKPLTKEVLVLCGAGFTQKQIADTLSMSLKQVEMIMANERKRQVKGSTK